MYKTKKVVYNPREEKCIPFYWEAYHSNDWSYRWIIILFFRYFGI